jgi:hypothetical protein
MRSSDHEASETVRSWDVERMVGVVCWMVVVPCCGLGEWRLVRPHKFKKASQGRYDEHMPGECILGATSLMKQDWRGELLSSMSSTCCFLGTLGVCGSVNCLRGRMNTRVACADGLTS